MHALAITGDRRPEMPLSLAALAALPLEVREKAPCFPTAWTVTASATNPLAYEEISSTRAAPRSIRSSRFLSVDPVPGISKKPQTWNRYAYAFNNPLNYTDPDGLFGDSPNDSTVFVPDAPCPPGAMGPCSTFAWSSPLHEGWFGGLPDSIRNLRNPVTGMTASEHWRVSGQGLAAFADGVIPDVPFCDACDEYTDPLGRYFGLYDENAPGMKSAQVIGAATRDVELALASSGSTTLFGRGSWANSNPLGAGRFRIGQSTFRKTGTRYFSMRGKWIDAWKGVKNAHVDLWILPR